MTAWRDCENNGHEMYESMFEDLQHNELNVSSNRQLYDTMLVLFVGSALLIFAKRLAFMLVSILESVRDNRD